MYLNEILKKSKNLLRVKKQAIIDNIVEEKYGVVSFEIEGSKFQTFGTTCIPHSSYPPSLLKAMATNHLPEEQEAINARNLKFDKTMELYNKHKEDYVIACLAEFLSKENPDYEGLIDTLSNAPITDHFEYWMKKHNLKSDKGQ